MDRIRVAINGFGRIGRQAFKIALEKPEIEIVAVNDLTDPHVLSHLLKYDSVYGVYGKKVEADDRHEKANHTVSSVGTLIVEGEKVPIFAEKDPAILPWKDLSVDVVLESTGRFTDSEKAGAHLKAGARKVIISAPAKDEGVTPTFIIGVNHEKYDTKQNIISNASCTTNCITPVIAVLHSKFGIEKMLMSTIHSYTAEQNLVDGPPPGGKSNDLRRARAAAVNIIPTSTGATIATTEVIPELKGNLGGASYRVPTPCGSLSDFSIVLKKKVTVDEINNAFIEAARHPMWEHVLEVTRDPIVSSDVIGNPHSSIIDLSLTQVVGGDLVKVVAWYDNEFGYSNRFVEQAILIGKR
ncbi:MAG: type I glyceraldehyde-3-phosphate dehydrogenase [Candidatus Doudnabacteria bacterium]|nr:type I glyceraldehyde-3-phosphate dehydrogenase [Candidatus Doudnabacteria bacterium]